MRNKTLITTMLVLAIIAIPALALADTEIYTYGGFTVVSQAYKRIALITSAGSFRNIFTGVAMFGMLAAGIMGLRGLASGRGNMLTAFISPLIGCMLFLSVMVPRESIYIYDPVLNGTTTIPGVPIGISKLAGFANMIERSVIDILDSNPAEIGEPRYQDVGVRGFELASELGTTSLGDEDFSGTLANYVKDCVIFELARPGTTMNFNTLWEPGSGVTVIDELGKANNPSIYTTSLMYDGGPTAMSCDEAYNDLKADSDTLSMPALIASLNSSGVPDQSAATAAMSTALAPILDAAGISSNPDKIISMQAVANITTAALSSNADAAALFSVEAGSAKSGLTGGVASGIVNPRMIDAYMSYAICIVPILFLFAATPLCGKIISYSLSLVIWIALARVVDVLAYHQWISEYMAAAGGFTSGGGLDFSFNYTSFFGTHLGQLADLRASAFLLASAISAAIFKFSDSSIAHLASRAAATASHATDTLDPGATARKIQETHGGVAREAAVQALAAGGGIGNMARGQMANEVSSAMSGAGKIDAANGSFSNLAGKERSAGGVETAQKWGNAEGKKDAAKGDLKTVESNERTTSAVGTTSAVAGAEGKKDAAGGTLENVAAKEHQRAAVNDSQAYGNADVQTPEQAYKTGSAHAVAAIVGKTANGTATQTDTNIQSGQSKTQVAGATLTHQGEQTIALSGAPAGADLTGRLSSSASTARREADSEISAETDRAAKTVSEDERRGKTLDNVVSSNQSMRNDKAAQEMYLKAKQYGKSSATQNSDNYTDQQSLNKSTGVQGGVSGSAGAGTGAAAPGVNANVGVNGGANAGINTNHTSTGSSTTGTNSAVSESENTIKNLQKMATSTGSDGISREQREAAQRALGYVISSTTGHDVSQTFNRLNESSRTEQQSQELAAAFRQDSGLAFYKKLAREQYGDDGATAVTNAIADTAKLVQTEEGQKIVQAQLQQFAESMAPKAPGTMKEPTRTIDHNQTAQKIEQTEKTINDKGNEISVPLTGPKKTLEPSVKGPDIDAASFDKEFTGIKEANKEHAALVLEAKKDLPSNAVEALVKEVAPSLATTNTPTVEGLRKGEINRAKSDSYTVGTANDYDIAGGPEPEKGTAGKALDKTGETTAAVAAGAVGTIPKIISGLAHAVPQIVGGLSGMSTTAVAANYAPAPSRQEPPAPAVAHTEKPIQAADHKPAQVAQDNNKPVHLASNNINKTQSVSNSGKPERTSAADHKPSHDHKPFQNHGPEQAGHKPVVVADHKEAPVPKHQAQASAEPEKQKETQTIAFNQQSAQAPTPVQNQDLLLQSKPQQSRSSQRQQQQRREAPPQQTQGGPRPTGNKSVGQQQQDKPKPPRR